MRVETTAYGSSLLNKSKMIMQGSNGVKAGARLDNAEIKQLASELIGRFEASYESLKQAE